MTTIYGGHPHKCAKSLKIEQFEYVGEQQSARLLKYNSEREDG